jgi:hypothetical protein
MATTIKRTDNLKQLREKLEKALLKKSKKKSSKGFDAKKYLNLNIFKGVDGLTFQKQMRDEWD